MELMFHQISLPCSRWKILGKKFFKYLTIYSTNSNATWFYLLLVGFECQFVRVYWSAPVIPLTSVSQCQNLCHS